MKTTFLTKIVNCKGTCSLNTFSMEKPALGIPFKHFVHIEKGKKNWKEIQIF